MRKINRYLIAPTSQFYYCGVPFRVDTSAKCTYDCQYCFSKLRGGYRSQKSNFLDLQRLNNSLKSKRSGIINELLSFKTPIHFGGMSDPHCNQDVSKITFSTLDILVDNKIASSKREAREFLTNGSITVNGNKITDENYVITEDNLLYNKYLIIRKGKKKYFIGK